MATNVVSLLPAPSYEEWVAEGKRLADIQRNLGFLIGDWLNQGREEFPEQQSTGLDEVGIDRRVAQRASTVARVITSTSRHPDLSFDHHRAVVKLPAEQRDVFLSRAAEDGLKVGQLKELVVQWRYETGELFDDEDVDSALLSIQVRAWNRATPQARQDFMDLAAIARLNIIDEDKPGGA